MIDFDKIFAIIKMQTTKTRQDRAETVRRGKERRKKTPCWRRNVLRSDPRAAERAAHRDGAAAV